MGKKPKIKPPSDPSLVRLLNTTRDWRVEYEIPPLRAVYTIELNHYTHPEATGAYRLLMELAPHQDPPWKILSLIQLD